MDAFEEDPSSAIDNKEYNIMDLPEEMLLKILSYLSPTEALWNLGFVCTSFLRLSLTSVKIIHVSNTTQLEILTRKQLLRDRVKHAIMTKHTDSIGREKLLNEMKRDCQKEGDSNILNFHGEPTDDDISIIARTCKHIEYVYLIDDDKISDLGFCKLLKSCKKLKTLNLCNCRQFTDISFKAIASNCKNIMHLDFANCIKISDEAITSISLKCRNIESLDLFGCHQLTNNAMIGLSENCRKLRKLSISHCFKIKDEGVMNLVKSCREIVNLDLTKCFQMTDKAIYSIATNCPKIKVLILVSCDKLTIEPMEVLIGQCPCLQFMDIKHCLKISDDKIKRLWVRYRKRLQSLNTGRTCLEEMEKIRQVMMEGTLSKEDFDKWRLEFYTGEPPPKIKNVG